MGKKIDRFVSIRVNLSEFMFYFYYSFIGRRVQNILTVIIEWVIIVICALESNAHTVPWGSIERTERQNRIENNDQKANEIDLLLCSQCTLHIEHEHSFLMDISMI